MRDLVCDWIGVVCAVSVPRSRGRKRTGISSDRCGSYVSSCFHLLRGRCRFSNDIFNLSTLMMAYLLLFEPGLPKTSWVGSLIRYVLLQRVSKVTPLALMTVMNSLMRSS